MSLRIGVEKTCSQVEPRLEFARDMRPIDFIQTRFQRCGFFGENSARRFQLRFDGLMQLVRVGQKQRQFGGVGKRNFGVAQKRDDLLCRAFGLLRCGLRRLV